MLVRETLSSSLLRLRGSNHIFVSLDTFPLQFIHIISSSSAFFSKCIFFSHPFFPPLALSFFLLHPPFFFHNPLCCRRELCCKLCKLCEHTPVSPIGTSVARSSCSRLLPPLAVMRASHVLGCWGLPRVSPVICFHPSSPFFFIGSELMFKRGK